MDDKRTYEPPSLQEIGTVAEQTLAQNLNGIVDNFHPGIPVVDIRGS